MNSSKQVFLNKVNSLPQRLKDINPNEMHTKYELNIIILFISLINNEILLSKYFCEPL